MTLKHLYNLSRAREWNCSWGAETNVLKKKKKEEGKKKVTKTRWEGLKCCWSCRHWGMLWNNMRKKWCEALLENHSLWNASVQCLNPPTNLLTDQPTAVTSPLGWHVGGIVNVRFQCLFFPFLFFFPSPPLLGILCNKEYQTVPS